MDTELAKLVFNQTVEKYHRALGEARKGDAQPFLDLFSTEDDISLVNPTGEAAQGYQEVIETAKQTNSQLPQTEVIDFKNLVTFVSCDFAYIVENERSQAMAGGEKEPKPTTVHATTIFRLESGGWKIVHRHADVSVASHKVPMGQ